MDKVRIRQKIKELRELLEDHNYYLDNSEQALGYSAALDDIEKFLDTLSEQPDKSLEEAALEAYPSTEKEWKSEFGTFHFDDTNIEHREGFIVGYEQAEKDLGWHSVDESLPPVDEEVIVLADRLNLGALFAISFGHIVDRMHCSDYNGWNIPGVKYWMPMPKLEEEK